MLDLAGVVTLIRWAFFGSLGLLLLLALTRNKTTKARVGWSLGVIAVFASVAGAMNYKMRLSHQRAMEEARRNGLPATPEEYKARHEAVKALFDERCKLAGQKIYNSVSNVEGVLLLNVRAEYETSNDANSNWPDAGLPNEYGGENYIANFLMWEHHEDKRSPRGYLNQSPSELPGYRYVDAKDAEGVMWRYTLRKEGEAGYPRLAKVELKGAPARYAVSFVNLIDSEDRKMWVAGTTVNVVDTQTSEVLAQATWYSFEPGQGSTASYRQPWRFARSCPELRGGQERAPTRFFVDQVLKPRR
jgi:hypothetical protein